jgi:hypothetical protein
MHIKAWVLADRQVSCWDRKSECTQNVMVACNFDKLFTYAYSGWEGTADDGCVFNNAIIPEQRSEWPTNV